MPTYNSSCNIVYMWTFTRSEQQLYGDLHFLTPLTPILTPSMLQNGPENEIGETWMPISNSSSDNIYVEIDTF